MSKKRKGKSGTPVVTFRSGDLLRELQIRTDGETVHPIASRDLHRYYELLTDGLKCFPLSPDEARLLTDVPLADVGPGPGAHRRFWATVADAIRDHGLAKTYGITDSDATAFVDRLRETGPAESRALIDALERFQIARKTAEGGLERLMREILPVRDETG